MAAFFAFGHPNILANHSTTLEFTKDTELTPRGDCIVGVKATFTLNELKPLLAVPTKIRITMKVDEITQELTAVTNPGFVDEQEMVIRKGDFVSSRTFAIQASKAASDLDRTMISKLQGPQQQMKVLIEKV